MKRYYSGRQDYRASEPVTFDTTLRDALDRDGRYLPAPGLVDAVNTAMMLGQPLLLSGEPGTGKSGAARAVAHELRLGDVLRVNCKEDLRSSDLFYVFDHMRRLHDANLGTDAAAKAQDYLDLQGLGAAIVRAAGAEARARPLRGAGQGPLLSELFPDVATGPGTQSVVLIDEIDKASRDVPNDLLFELDEFHFDIPELGLRIAAPGHRRPFVIITTNSEKSLPAPFLRRCVFYAIPFPDLDASAPPSGQGVPAYTLENIVAGRLGAMKGSTLLAEGLELFARFRDPARIEDRPSPAEFMAWLLVLNERLDGDRYLHSAPDVLDASLSLLLKNERDMRKGRRIVADWIAER